MAKRCTVQVFAIEEIDDDFGGHVEKLVLNQILHGTLTTNTHEVITDIKGSNIQMVTWLKVHKEIPEPNEKVLTIKGVNYRIVGVVNGIGKRFYYQLEQLTGGEIYAN